MSDAMNDDELIAIIRERESQAERASDLDEDRAKAIRYYQGEPFGNEQEGRSRVVSRDVFEAVEGVKPDLLRIFTGGDAVVRFEPEGPEDIEQADQETEYINYLIMERGSGWMAIHDWLCDALLLRNGYVLAYWDKRESVTEATYSGLSDEEVAALESTDGVEVLEQQTDEAPDGPAHTVKVRETSTDGQVRIKALAPERLLIAARHADVSLRYSPFVEYWEDKSISELREEGFDVEDDIGLSDGEGDLYADGVEQARRHDQLLSGDDDGDPSMRIVRVRTCWVRVDYDGDGIAELRRVTRVGATVLYNELDECCTIACATTTRLAHRHVGISMFDQTEDVQLIKSTLLRGRLDNLYLANNGRVAINEDTVNIDDLMTSRVGGIVRVIGSPGSEIMPLQHADAGGDVLQTIEYLDTVKETRTGITRYNQGLDANSLNKTASGISQILNQAQMKTELRARVLAETGFKDLFLIVHMLVLKHRNRADIFALRNRYVPVNPTEWKTRRNMRVTVGLGTGDSVTRMRNLQMITTAQQAVMPMGLAGREQLYSGLIELTKAAGFKDAQSFWLDPKENQAPPPQQDPKLIEAQAKMQIEQQRLQLDAQKAQLDAQEREKDRQADLLKARAQQQHDGDRAFLEAQVRVATAALSHDAGRGEVKRQAAQTMGVTTDDAAELDAQHEQRLTMELLAAQIADLSQAMAALARPRAVRHIRDAQGRIVRSEAVEG